MIKQMTCEKCGKKTSQLYKNHELKKWVCHACKREYSKWIAKTVYMMMEQFMTAKWNKTMKEGIKAKRNNGKRKRDCAWKS